MVGVDEVRPSDLARLPVLVEERPHEVPVVVGVADDETEFRRPDGAANERRQLVVDGLADPRPDERAEVLLVRRRHVVEAHPGRPGRAGHRLGIARRRGERIEVLEIDRDVECRTRRPHQPVVLGLRGRRERGGKAALATGAEFERRHVTQEPRQAASPNACLRIVVACRVTHLLASIREGMRSA